MIRSTLRSVRRAMLRQAMTDLTATAATVDSLCATSSPSMSLLEASRAIHNALVALEDWSGASNDDLHPAHLAASP